ncbi:MerR family transcriptional regulator [Anaerorhabdus sp.]|jgi:MerR family transcriptional regulator, thiopeptide resistance regulator|uniref:MerR family transcriptional regulator n=1 Tax=Anaerorhabdus sp. TaxID=1872524 RepID=UPI002FC601D1
MNENYLTIGEVAKKMNVTVRTLQYYDTEGLLKPSMLSEGGRRLYTSKDLIKLYQILSFKSLGFSLEDIKERILKMDTPEEVCLLLKQQEKIIEEQIKAMKLVKTSLRALKEEVIQMKEVDFNKYADIIQLLKMGNKEYWVIKLFDEELMDYFKERFTDHEEDGKEILNTYKEVVEKAINLKNKGIAPESDEAIELASKWWEMIMEFTKGDFTLLGKLMEFNDNKDNWDQEMASKQKEIDDYIGHAIDAYLKSINVKFPLEEK